MKLVSFITILVCLTVTVKSQKYQEESFSFPPQFQTPNSNLFYSDSSVYLPPESQTSIPFYTLNNSNKLPYQYLSPTGTKAPSFYSTPFPMIMSSTSKSSFEDDNDNDDRNNQHRRLINIKQTPYVNVNNTSASRQLFEKKEFERNSRNPSFSNGEKSFAVKSQNYMSSTNPPIQNFIKPAARRMIITSEFQKVDSDMDQVKSASLKNSQYVQAPGIFISSTTEPAVPILRLSNEMDLDGSFSYEALGADQTHYVQHSRMENMGTDKEEQVVEGSYSYVGDDGRTYTVHYVADSNGFRASGDHLPVPPPIPEIIQRSIQYNLAEEAKRPPHLKSSWENEEREYVGEETRRNVYHVPPPRSLFTGRTPEAFSLGFFQGSMPNSVKITSSSAPNKTNYEVNVDQSKSKGNIMVSPISPQITFLASQGAHNPAIQSHSTKVIGMEKSPLPKLMNYEAEMKEHEQEANKALWRWQYGLNTETNDNPTKNSISRSSSDSDDIYINFSDMTPNQYKQIMQTQILGKNTVESNTLERSTEVQFSSPRYTENINPYDANNINSERLTNLMTEKYQSYTSTEHSDLYAHESQKPKMNFNIYSDIISSYNFTPQSQIATQSYNVEVTSFEPSPINAINEMSTNYSTMHINNYPYNNNYKDENNSIIEIAKTQTPSIKSTHDYLNNGKHLDVQIEEKNTFKPLLIKTEVDFRKYETTTTEAPFENIIKDNIFLRNLFKSPEKEIIDQKPVVENNNINYQKPVVENNNINYQKPVVENNNINYQKPVVENNNINYQKPVVENNNINYQKPLVENNNINYQKHSELIIDKVPKYIQFEQHPQNDVKYFNSKPLDLGDVLNYVVMKNHFESVKTKPKNKPTNNYNQNSNIKDGNAVHYIPIKENNENREINKKDTDYQVLNNEQQQELHGLIKNYKVLQRRKNLEQKNQFPAELPRHIKTFHTPGLPPLGRAGPSLKSYLPPTYL